ncbi:esterase FE4-like [Ctenocephalides felis]|uniref:esterase FE4-like n=1 Tax=Ctenocephalides felis TaxID=7515 RepID=UPI000E6E5893|nr:esterase FE4-like [Ctenocephalides felis]
MSKSVKLNSLFKLIFLIFLCNLETSDSQIVRLQSNFVLKGTVLKTLKGREIYSFLKVPYAVPPLGELRFKAPVPLKSSPDNPEVFLDCTKDAPICTQRNPYIREEKVSGQEDCLYLSIHTPKLKDEDENENLLPVMVFLHGGGFMCGSGISSFYGPEHLLDRDVVLVGVNYRLGPLGFLSTGDLNCPGNNGLKDQNLALKWIKDNIAKFSGDPSSITLFGESAGGASVDYHMLSEKSKGLFHKAIAQSGTSLCPWAAPPVPGEPETRARILAQKLGCWHDDYDWSRALRCLRQLPAEIVTSVFYEFFQWDTDPMIAFPPVVEPEHPDAFITEHPRKIMLNHGKTYWGAQIPLMTGVTKDEGALKTASLFGIYPHLAKELDEKWNDIAPILLQYEAQHLNDDGSHSKRLSRAIRDAYLPNGASVCEDTRRNVTDLMSDHWFVSCMHETVRARRRLPPSLRAATYVYLFAYRGAASFTRIFGDKEKDYGVSKRVGAASQYKG